MSRMLEPSKLVALDTETTGLSPKHDHRIVEIGCIDVCEVNGIGQSFHTLLNPERSIPWQVRRVHGISNDMVRTAPTFPEIFSEFFAFTQKKTLLIHNASFDMAFLHAECRRAGHPGLCNHVIDTLTMARRLFPKQKNNLTDLSHRLGVKVQGSDTHRALYDATLVAECYLKMLAM